MSEERLRRHNQARRAQRQEHFLVPTLPALVFGVAVAQIKRVFSDGVAPALRGDNE